MAKKSARESILQEKTVKSPKVKIQADSRYKALQSFSVISILVVVLICFVANILLGLVLDKPLTFDSTSVHINTVGTFTKDFLKNLDKKVEIYGLFDRNDSSSATEWKEYLLPIMDDYEAKADGKISLSYIDPDVNPFIISELDPDGLYGVQKNMYVLKCGERVSVINPYRCFSYDQTMASEYGVGVLKENNVELIFTSNLVYVTSDSSLHAYYLTGHSEETKHTYLDSILVTLGMQTDTLNLSGGASTIPTNCDLIIILQPKQDITEAEAELLKLYAKNGGNLMVVNDYGDNKTVEYTNLNSLCNQMGISLEKGLIHENNADCLIQAADPFTSWALLNSDYYSSFEYSAYYSSNNRYLSTYRDKADNIIVYPLLTTSDEATVDLANLSVSDSVSAGKYPVVLMSEDANEVQGVMIVFATQSFTSDDYYAEKTLNDPNAEFVRHSLGAICRTPINVQIPSKTVPNYSLQKPLSSDEITAWSVVVMTIIPIGCLACGIFIYKKRRHL